ncbi:SDR family NAD(P)-dependent oxidoreductase [Labrys monachus]|uniref:NAD(P)-dependent dehydrogenase (Short-subunit alcohol dehydrogenase family) n=1 Tax=Labrys monachus TaxID=217067 RepID=A0ABU0FHD7_9HYPH|nr:SDR family oxidoreductase [Labrys monachus]MDQ0393752.1 NAD(P)-dependent dehydrogenase (short-subunit alcohol dehydrogenase family) [Labrys monachus]
MPKVFQGRVVLVAGLASGLGEVIATRFAEDGAKLILSDPTADVAAMARKIQGDHPTCQAIGVVADFTDCPSCERLVATTMEKFGPIDVLIIATVTLHMGSVVSTEPDDWDRVMAFNAKGPFLLCKTVVPKLTRPGGAIGVIGSFTAQMGFANAALYSASKAAEMSLVRTLAVELAQEGIRVNTVAPGYLWSNVDQQSLEAAAQKTGRTLEEVRAARDSTIPMRRQADAREIAEAMHFIVSPAASYITGACLDVNGGLLVR